MLADNQKNSARPYGASDPTSTSPQPSEQAACNECVPKLHQKAEKLRSVAQQVESFLMRQIDRLQRELDQAETWSDRSELERVTDEFEQMREKWDAERQLERNRLQEDSQRLAEAWQRLEAEQRELLKYRVSNNKVAGLGVSRQAPRSVGPLSPTHPVAVSAESSLACSASVATAPPSALKNQLQFQQLRREMMEHARQRGKR